MKRESRVTYHVSRLHFLVSAMGKSSSIAVALKMGYWFAWVGA